MTRPDEIAALADRLELHTKELANQPLCMTMSDWSQLSNDMLAAAQALRLTATLPGDPVREVLRAHWLHQIVCNHEDGTDKPCCSCSMWNCPPQPSIGAAVEAWIDHVIEHLTKAGDDLVSYFGRQIEWSRQTFGPALRTKGVIDHIRKELREIEASPHDLSEWVDVIILAMDGFWRHGGEATALLPALLAKQQKNMARTWPDWRSMSEDGAIEHDRTKDAATPTPPSAVPERETHWLVERAGTGLYVKHGTVGGNTSDLTDDVWKAERFKDEFAAFDFVRLCESPWAKELKPAEHVFINKLPVTPQPPSADDVAWLIAEIESQKRHYPANPEKKACFERIKASIQSAAVGCGTKSDGARLSSLPSGESEPLVTTASAPSDTMYGEYTPITVRASSAPSDPAQEPEAVADWQVRLGASEYACYRWPDDTAEHRAMRAAFCDGASHAHTRPVSLDREAVKADDLAYTLESIILRRLRDDKVAGYAFETAKEQADAILALIEGRT